MPIRILKRPHAKLCIAWFPHAPVVSFLLSLALFSGCFKPDPELPNGKGNGTSDMASTSKSQVNATTQIAFREVNNPLLSSVHFSNGADAGMNSILEIMGGGVSCFDFDLDGNCDLLFPGGGVIDQAKKTVGGQASYFLRNRGEWRFEDCSGQSSLDTSAMYTHGATIADYNNDGFDDALFYGYRGILLFQNQGDGTFLQVDLNLPTISFPWLTAAAWFDLEDDGDLDLHLVSYVNWDFETHFVCSSASGKADVCSPTSFLGSIDLTLANQNDGSFADATPQLLGENNGRGLGVVAARMESHLPTSLYVANDLSPNFFYVHEDKNKMVERGLVAGLAVDAQGRANGSMGVALLDYNLDEKFDIFVTNFEHEDLAMYQNDGNDLYRHSSRETRLSGLTDGVVGFGVVAADFDLDGDEDVVLTAGHVYYHPAKGTTAQKPVVLENQVHKWFQRASVPCEYFKQTHIGRGLATADFDNDGDLDLVVTHLDAPPTFLENTVNQSDHHTLQLKLIGTRTNRSAVGAIGTLEVDGVRMSRQVYGGGSYLSCSQSTAQWGWKGNPKGKLKVTWLDGQSQEIEIDTSNDYLILIEP